MGFVLQQFINGLTVGGIYALIALGYTMVYGVLKLINFAHGDLCILGAFIGLTVLTTGLLGGLPAPALMALAFLVAVIVAALAGMLLERLAYRPLRRAHRLSPVVSALGASMLIENGIMLIWGPNVRVFPDNLLPSVTWQIGGAYLSFVQLLIIAGALVLMVAL
ncbi:MAG: branched-chain amino acid ABC transporter permease, partial [Burkholderiaceae bacterium]|nr:branched-chain amino acid ABC transporter permease [Burkholderiaceae bacterium]